MIQNFLQIVSSIQYSSSGIASFMDSLFHSLTSSLHKELASASLPLYVCVSQDSLYLCPIKIEVILFTLRLNIQEISLLKTINLITSFFQTWKIIMLPPHTLSFVF